MSANSSIIDFGRNPLIPAVVQDDNTGEVLMVGFMNDLAFERTLETGYTHFWSRSRNQLWKKGELSGHVQAVVSIAVNCEQNALLLKVQQEGAVCHEGYSTCFYREIDSQGALRLVRDRSFDPSTVYGKTIDQTELWFGAYVFLRDHDLKHASQTSRILHSGDPFPRSRVADELEELSGVLYGSHRHTGRESDVLLEGSQCLYWLVLAALREDLDWNQVRPDRALVTVDEETFPETAAALLLAESARWRDDSRAITAAVIHGAIALVAQAVRSANVGPMRLIEADLQELRSQDYLQPYFESLAEG